jgi:hypothetical protein
MRDAQGIIMYTKLPSTKPMRLLTACRVRGTSETTEEIATATGIEIEVTEDVRDPHTIGHHDAKTITRTRPVETTVPERGKIDMVVQDVMIGNGTETGARGAATTTDGETVTSSMTEEVVVAAGGIEMAVAVAVVEKTATNSLHKRKAGRATALLQRNESRHQT